MKFAKLLQQILQEGGVPPEWVEKAIQYKALKKRINRVVEELENVGLKRENMSFTYEIEQIQHQLRPQLTTDVSQELEQVVISRLNDMDYSFSVVQKEGDGSVLTVSLHEDTLFFQTLYEELEELKRFGEEQEHELVNTVENLATVIGKVGSPNTRKNDMYVWREIFQMYIESEVFFSTRERSSGRVDVAVSRKRLSDFVDHVNETKVLKRLRQRNSLAAFATFKEMNFLIIKVANYQAINSMAVQKILKKFDKQTTLNSLKLFPDVVKKSFEANILNSTVYKDVCAVIGERLLSIVPQLDDYTCPICCTVAFKPIRLDCGHLFCVRCLVKLQRKEEDKCPLCRQQVVLHADERNLDVAQMAYLKLYFPQEVKQKQREDEKEIFKEQYGHIVDPDKPTCTIV
ncbi:hypothetical protein KL929_001404 [Ogataea haglerorum]|uniref:uncharacterized protein n=1 Tax=Ogataea haglerorum TaxID=1937702 RepID=UPI001C897A3F|nr:uncharacterized protein KL911_001832 [Ogataea haglerorum]KAG7721143.1 hypothetical protein KL913_000879 [Ogataea haglerorum]KAG7721897.1 hypothetical protein KL949_000875 [Ogataea haglerorum]KAG7749391.1 hypothetical protein KL912_001392 [Ogataea haglerorum]KAG7755775.1 hypothetical protein KL911_001832 [Ogataea haglerorum]KAG7760460.1 hypothetical protein KL947_001304 [Ogataea haglerorum]